MACFSAMSIFASVLQQSTGHNHLAKTTNVTMNTLRVVLLIGLMLAVRTASSAERFFFEQISLNEGLSQATVKVIYRDYMGMIWAGTRDGLNRYDGQRVRSYYHDPAEAGSLPDNDIYFIIEDSLQRLWVGTHGIVSRYDRSADRFVPQHINGVALSLRNVFRWGSKLYSTTGNSLLIHDAASDSWTERAFKGDETNVTAAARFERLRPGVLLLASRWKGLFLCDIATGQLTRAPFFKGVNVLDVCVDSRNRIWVSEYGRGLVCFDARGNLLIDLRNKQKAIRADKIMDILEYRGALWLASDGEGVLVYSEEKRAIEKLNRQSDNANSLQVNSLLSLYADRFGTLWMGSVRNGLLAVRTIYVNTYGRAPLNSSLGLSEPTVLSFYEASNRELWIGTDGQGINRFDPVTQQFRHFPSTFGTKVTAITKWSERELLVSLYKDGLHLFDKQTGSLKAFPLHADDGTPLFMSDWIGISMARSGDKVYIADEAVYEYTPSTGNIVKLPVVKPGEGGVKVEFSSVTPHLLYIVTGRCVYGYYTDTGSVRCFVDAADLGAGSINAATFDKSGSLWLGMSKGLFRMDTRSGKAEQLMSGEIKTVSSIVADRQSSVWFSSGTRLYRYHLLKKQAYEYGRADGIRPDEYLPKSRLVGRSGDIYLGGVSGFVHIDRAIPFPNAVVPEFELLDIQLDGSLLSPERRKLKNNRPLVTLPWNHTSVQLNLFVNTPTLASSPVVRYRLESLSENWQLLDNQVINLQTLPSGTYKLLLQYELQHEQWSEAVELVSIRVLAPWWKTWWFYMLLTVAMAAVLWRYRHQAIKRARQQMELEMQHRENALSEQKIRFLINISHELRTPLTLVYAPLRRLVHDEQTPEWLRPLLALMYKHVKNMKNMIDMVLDVRKMEMTQDVALNRRPVNMNECLQQLTDDFVPEATARGMRIVFAPDTQVESLNLDRDRCEKVVMNLLMNALKFSEEGMVITVATKWLGDRIRVSVEDQGPGVAPGETSRLFTRFYQASHQKGGTGIGLSYARAQVELHGGTIGYTPAVPQGSVFWFELPVEPVQSISPESFDELKASRTVREAGEGAVQLPVDEFNRMTVLLVEDEPDLLRYMKESLAGSFYKVITAAQGDEALQKVYDFTPDLVVSDVMMPVMDGFELCRRIKTDVKVSHIPVVLLTALGDSDSSLTGYKMGADVYLSKPFGVDLLLAIMANVLRTRELLRRQYAGASAISTRDIAFSNADEKFLAKLTQLIDASMEESEIRMDGLAAEMAMSRTSFYSKVKTITGMSANNFVIDYKMKKAMVLLSDTSLSVQEIALKLGFQNQRYFSTVFKSVAGKSPTKWRDDLGQSQSNV